MAFPDSVDTPNRLTLGPNRPRARRVPEALDDPPAGDGTIVMKKNLVPVLGIAVVVAILSTAIFYGLVAGKLSGPAGAGASVVIASRNIAKGATIAEEDVKVIQWSGPAPEGAHATIQAVSGLTTLEAIAANEPITTPRVASAHSGSGAGLGIPKGMRAMSVMVSDSTGLLTILQRGHKVDVQAVHVRGNVSDVDVRTILENIEVLRVDPKPENTPGRSNLPVVTLIIRPTDADRLAAVDSGAKVRLTLRNPLDGDSAPLSPATLTGVMSGRTASAVKPPAPPAAAPAPAAVPETPAQPAPVRTANLR